MFTVMSYFADETPAIPDITSDEKSVHDYQIKSAHHFIYEIMKHNFHGGY